MSGLTNYTYYNYYAMTSIYIILPPRFANL